LLIDGAWQDHLLFAMLDRDFLRETRDDEQADAPL
jgi:hypothetical protein